MLIEILLGLMVAIVVYNLIHHFIVIRGSKKYQLQFQKRTDGIVAKIVNQIKAPSNSRSPIQMKNSSVLSDVWGREILVFEYDFDFHKSDQNAQIFVQRFKEKLNNYCLTKKILYRNRPQIVVTDVWEYDKILHIDIACLSNDATFDYIEDLKRLK